MRLICQPWAAPTPSAVQEPESEWRKRLLKHEALEGGRSLLRDCRTVYLEDYPSPFKSFTDGKK